MSEYVTVRYPGGELDCPPGSVVDIDCHPIAVAFPRVAGAAAPDDTMHGAPPKEQS